MKDEHDLSYVVGSLKDTFKHIIGATSIDHLHNSFKVNHAHSIANEVKFNISINFIQYH